MSCVVICLHAGALLSLEKEGTAVTCNSTGEAGGEGASVGASTDRRGDPTPSVAAIIRRHTVFYMIRT